MSTIKRGSAETPSQSAGPAVQPTEAQTRSTDLQAQGSGSGNAQDSEAPGNGMTGLPGDAASGAGPGVGSGSGTGAAGDTSAREEAIRQAAYERYLRRGASESGNELDDWLEAERSIDDPGGKGPAGGAP